MPVLRRRPPPSPHFPVGGPVPGPDLVGREAYLRRLVDRLQDGTHVLVAGPRRIGKTSIIHEALRRLGRKGALVAYVDCLGATDLRGLGEQLANAALAPLTGTERALDQARDLAAGGSLGKLRYADLAPLLGLARERSAARAFELALDVPRLVATRSGRRVVVALDEFQAAGRLSSRAFDVMRAHFQAQRGVAYAFLGSEEGVLEELFSEKGRAFYRFAQPLDLAEPGGDARFGIAPEDWVRYLIAKYRAKRVRIGEAEVDRILDATGGHPQDTMQVCARLLELARDTGVATIDGDLVAIAYEQSLRELERPFALHWAELGKQKYLQQVAKRIAHGAVLYGADGAVPRAEVLRALDALRARGLVVRVGRGRYEFLEPMFGEYVRRLDEPVGDIVRAK
ncbi:MAG TPA: ATP-binding protein [Candidatus Limnocylindria bacterium]|nr:ATP-binding protein [Candidatus Limnocylindria bacterium]